MLATVATHHTPTSILLRVSVTILRDAFLQRLSVTLLVVVAACDGVSHLDDTLGVQSSARWEWHGRITVTQDPRLTLALALGRARDLRQNVPYTLGPADARIPAYATVTCFCQPLKPDSVRGTFRLATRGLRQITGRVDATLYFTEWNDPTRHTTYPLHQRIDLPK